MADVPSEMPIFTPREKRIYMFCSLPCAPAAPIQIHFSGGHFGTSRDPTLQTAPTCGGAHTTRFPGVDTTPFAVDLAPTRL